MKDNMKSLQQKGVNHERHSLDKNKKNLQGVVVGTALLIGGGLTLSAQANSVPDGTNPVVRYYALYKMGQSTYQLREVIKKADGTYVFMNDPDRSVPENQVLATNEQHYISIKSPSAGAGDGNYDNKGAKGAGDIAIGVGAYANSVYKEGISTGGTMAIGSNAKTDKPNSVVIGHRAQDMKLTLADGSKLPSVGGSVVIGEKAGEITEDFSKFNERAKEYQQHGVKAKEDPFEKVLRAIELPSGARPFAIEGNVFTGREAGIDAFTTQSVLVGTGSGTKLFGYSNTMLGAFSATNLRGDYNTGVGYYAAWQLKGNDNIALGRQSGYQSQGDNNISLGKETGKNIKGDKNIAIGRNTNSFDALSEINETIAIGDNTKVTGKKSASVGNDNNVSVENTFVLGSNVTGSVANSVYLGHQSAVTSGDKIGTKNLKADGTEGNTTTAGETGTVDKATFTINGEEKEQKFTFAGAKASGAVSVGFSGGERRLQNLAAGEISATSTDAINGSQLFAVASEVYKGLNFDANTGGVQTSKLGSTVTIKGADENTDASKFDAGKNLMTSIEKQGEDSVVRIALAKDLDIDSVKAGETLLNNEGLSVGDKVKVSNTGITAGDVSLTTEGINAGNTKITNVAAGEDKSDAVNVGQLTAVADQAKAAATKLVAGDGVTVESKQLADKSTEYTVSAKTDGTTMTTVGGAIAANTTTFNTTTDGTVGAPLASGALVTADTVQSAINSAGFNVIGAGNKAADQSGDFGKQLVKAGNTVTFEAGENLTLKQDGTQFTFATKKDVSFNSVTVGDVTVDSKGINAGNTKITNVAAGTDNSDAVNVGQLKTVEANVDKGLNFNADKGGSKTSKLGSTVAIKGADKNIQTEISQDAEGNTNISIALAKDLDINSVKAGKTLLNNEGLSVGDKVKVSDKGITAGDVSLTTEGINAGGKQITNVAAGKADTDAVNYAQLKEIEAQVKASSTKLVAGDGVTVDGGKQGDGSSQYTISAKTDGTTIQINDNGAIAANTTTFNTTTDGTVGTPVTPGALVTADTVQSAINNAGFNVIGAGNKADPGAEFSNQLVKAGNTVTFEAGDNLTLKQEGTQFTFALAKDVSFDSVSVGDVKVTNTGITVGDVSLSTGGINAGGKQITNVAAGKADTDAVNVSQLKAAVGGFNNVVNHLGNEIHRVDREARAGTASAAAMANLPQAYLPGKSMFAIAGAGHRGEHGYAAGLSTISDNGKWIIKSSVSGNTRGDVTYGAGVGYQW